MECEIKLGNAWILHADYSQAMEWLEKAYAERTPLLRGLQTSRPWDGLRSDPRYKDLMNRIGLPQK